MKTSVLFFSGLFFLSLITFGQNNVNLVIFSEDGDKFFAYVNGIKQNDAAESNVKVTGVTPNISLRIEFDDKALPQLKQNMALEPGFEHTAKIKRDMKKQLKLRYFGSTPLNNSSTASVPTVAYHTADDGGSNTYNTASTNNNNNNNGSSNYTATSTTTQMNTGTNTNPNGSAVNISVDGMNMNMNVSGLDANGNTITQSTTTTTVSSSSSSSYESEPRRDHYQHKGNNQTELQTSSNNATCRTAMPQASFDKMKQSVEAKPFSDTKMSTAKLATKSNCMSVSQVKIISKLFSMDDEKLEYAKYAYDYCIDKGNYYQVSEVFSFSTTTDDLNKFLEGH